MNIELQKQLFSVYQQGETVQGFHEDTMETIAPEYCPDIARITAVKHRLHIQNCTTMQEKMVVAGVVHLDLLYIAQDNSGVRSLHYDFPFTHTVEIAGMTAAAWGTAEGSVTALETRLLNPRKVLTRMRLSLRMRAWLPMQMALTTGVSEGDGVELQQELVPAMLYLAPSQKSFSVEGELPLSGAREEVEELLHTNARAELHESRVIGGKILIKGTVYWEVLYRSVSRKLCRSTAEMPFSQILAAESATESSQFVRGKIWVNQMECRLNGEEEGGRTVMAQAEVTVFGITAEEQELLLVTDLYSTQQTVKAQTTALSLARPMQEHLFRQTAKELIEPGVAVDAVVSASVYCGEVATAGRELSVRVLMELLYLDENGMLLCAERQAEVRATADCDLNGGTLTASVGEGDILSHVVGGNAELRFTVEFRLETQSYCSHRCVSMVEEAEEERRERPALILRRLQEGETAWELAKQNRLTVAELRAANGLEEKEPFPKERFLLIPSRR